MQTPREAVLFMAMGEDDHQHYHALLSTLGGKLTESGYTSEDLCMQQDALAVHVGPLQRLSEKVNISSQSLCDDASLPGLSLFSNIPPGISRWKGSWRVHDLYIMFNMKEEVVASIMTRVRKWCDLVIKQRGGDCGCLMWLVGWYVLYDIDICQFGDEVLENKIWDQVKAVALCLKVPTFMGHPVPTPKSFFQGLMKEHLDYSASWFSMNSPGTSKLREVRFGLALLIFLSRFPFAAISQELHMANLSDEIQCRLWWLAAQRVESLLWQVWSISPNWFHGCATVITSLLLVSMTMAHLNLQFPQHLQRFSTGLAWRWSQDIPRWQSQASPWSSMVAPSRSAVCQIVRTLRPVWLLITSTD